MKYFFLWMIWITACAPNAWAQASCTSEGQNTPASLTERFISADCEVCWTTPTDSPTTNDALTIDWIVPSASADAAPLSAAASRDALARLRSLGLSEPSPIKATVIHTPVASNTAIKLRVAHGLALGGYIGASIELTVDSTAAVKGQSWLLLVETIPAGVEGTPITRNLVRNMLLPAWPMSDQQPTPVPQVFREMRPMGIPYGATPERLRVLGWVQAGKGTVLTATQSVCAPVD